MAISRRVSKEREQLAMDLRLIGEALLRGMERQKALARETIAAPRAMHDRAVKMGKIPKFRLP